MDLLDQLGNHYTSTCSRCRVVERPGQAVRAADPLGIEPDAARRPLRPGRRGLARQPGQAP
jgi:hypothetical protein